MKEVIAVANTIANTLSIVQRMETLKYCHEHINSISKYTEILDYAASRGHLDLQLDLSKCTFRAMNLAAYNGYPIIVKFS
jgi:hypothetical protein